MQCPVRLEEPIHLICVLESLRGFIILFLTINNITRPFHSVIRHSSRSSRPKFYRRCKNLKKEEKSQKKLIYLRETGISIFSFLRMKDITPRCNIVAISVRQRDPAVFSITSFLLHSYSILGEDEFEEDEEEYWLLPRAHPPAREWRRWNYWKIPVERAPLCNIKAIVRKQ